MKQIGLVVLIMLLAQILPHQFLTGVSKGDEQSAPSRVEAKAKSEINPIFSGVLVPGKPIFIPVTFGPR